MKNPSFLRVIILLVALARAATAEEPAAAFESKIMGDWVLENARGTPISPMQIQQKADGLFQLVRIGGGALAVSGDYKREGSKLVKVAKPNDPYWDLTWHYASSRLKLKKGDYKDWTLVRKAWKPRP